MRRFLNPSGLPLWSLVLRFGGGCAAVAARLRSISEGFADNLDISGYGGLQLSVPAGGFGDVRRRTRTMLRFLHSVSILAIRVLSG